MRRQLVWKVCVTVMILVAGCFTGAWASDAGQDDPSLAEVFDAVDADHDGRLSRDEYAVIWKNGTDVERKFRFFDRDGSGFIERQEFLALPGQAQ